MEAAERLSSIAARCAGQIIRNDVGCCAQPEIVHPLVDPGPHLARRFGAQTTELVAEPIAEGPLVPSVQHDGHRERGKQRREHREDHELGPQGVEAYRAY